MTQAPDLPAWVAILVAVMVLTGAGVTLIGSLGLLRLGSFYERVHAPTLGATLGMLFVILGSMVCFSVLESRALVHEILIALFITLTTPVTLMLLGRAALYRDRVEGAIEMPADQDTSS